MAVATMNPERNLSMTQRLRMGAVLLALTAAASLHAAENTLSEREKRDGWLLLFDGRTTQGWMTPKRQAVPQTHVQDGSLNPHPCDYMLVQEKPWENFILSLDFKISKGCNSGVF